MAQARNQGWYAMQLEQAIKAAGIDPDSEESIDVWKRYADRGYAAALNLLALTAPSPVAPRAIAGGMEHPTMPPA